MKTIFTFLLLLPLYSLAQTQTTANDVVEAIKENVTCEWSAKTVDTFKAGDPESKVKGIAVCMFADMLTLQKAVELGCNFIITHEPIFYNHWDETKDYRNDPVYRTKQAFIKKHNLVIFRYHDHIHRTKPDGIYAGMIAKLGWKKFSKEGSFTRFSFPKMTLTDLSLELKANLQLESVRIIGDPQMEFQNVVFSAGAPGGQRHINALAEKDVEVLVAGEAPEWETYLYVNDAIAQGKNKAVVFLGHLKSEEAGMEYCTHWLQEFIQNVPIHFIPNKPNYRDL